jgi:hypothetical protein
VEEAWKAGSIPSSRHSSVWASVIEIERDGSFHYTYSEWYLFDNQVSPVCRDGPGDPRNNLNSRDVNIHPSLNFSRREGAEGLCMATGQRRKNKNDHSCAQLEPEASKT